MSFTVTACCGGPLLYQDGLAYCQKCLVRQPEHDEEWARRGRRRQRGERREREGRPASR